MKNSFWDAVGVPFEIKLINAESLSGALEIAYRDSKYCFCGSSWFIDIKDNFRTFKHRGSSYISKRTSEKKADSEIANSQIANKRLKGKVVGSKTIKIVIPQKIISTFDRDHVFLVSEYFGADMNECVYKKTKPNISLEECLLGVKLLLENGISHSGYLPRNIVEKENDIYFFDWEDAIFSDSSTPCMFDHLWRTNFLLNWSYLFKYNDLDNGLKNSVKIQYPLEEPELVKYETTFRDVTNIKDSDFLLRNIIENTVFDSELPLKKNTDNFYIRPNDMGHLIADVFPCEIDVLNDILSSTFRRYNEIRFSYHIQVMTRLFVEYFNAILVKNHHLSHSLQYYALIPILMMLDDYISIEEYKFILTGKGTFDELIKNISKVYKDGSISKTYLSGGSASFSNSLNHAIQNKISELLPSTNVGKYIVNNKLISFITKESIQHTKEITTIYSDEYVEVCQDRESTVPGMYVIRPLNYKESILDLSDTEFRLFIFIQRQLRIGLKKIFNIEVCGLYIENHLGLRVASYTIPFHIEKLKEKYSVDVYQPYIAEYIKGYGDSEARRKADLFNFGMRKMFDEANVRSDLEDIKKGLNPPTRPQTQTKEILKKVNLVESLVEVMDESELPTAPAGKKYFVCIGGRKNFQCFLCDNNQSKGEFIFSHEKEISECLKPVYSDSLIVVRQDAKYAIPGFYIVSPKSPYRTIDEMPRDLYENCMSMSRNVLRGLSELGIDRTYVYHDEKYKSPSSAHFWVLPIYTFYESDYNLNLTIYSKDIWTYLNTFPRYSETKTKILEFNDKMENYLSSHRYNR